MIPDTYVIRCTAQKVGEPDREFEVWRGSRDAAPETLSQLTQVDRHWPWPHLNTYLQQCHAEGFSLTFVMYPLADLHPVV